MTAFLATPVSTSGIILLAEDNSNDALVVGLGFRIAGITDELVVVRSEEEFVRFVKAEGVLSDSEYAIPRLILLDLEMSQLDCLAVLKWLREQPLWSCVPIIALTSSPYLRELTRAYQLGANSFLTKPGDLSQFVAKISQMADSWLRVGAAERAH